MPFLSDKTSEGACTYPAGRIPFRPEYLSDFNNIHSYI
jgi:hypothetical protein